MYHTPLNLSSNGEDSNNQRIFNNNILNGNANVTPLQRINQTSIPNSTFSNNSNTCLFNNNRSGNNVSLSDELPLLELNELSLVESSNNQNFRVRSLLNPRGHIQSQHRFHNKKILRPKLLQQRNSREKKFPFTTIRSISNKLIYNINYNIFFYLFICLY